MIPFCSSGLGGFHESSTVMGSTATAAVILGGLVGTIGKQNRFSILWIKFNQKCCDWFHINFH